MGVLPFINGISFLRPYRMKHSHSSDEPRKTTRQPNRQLPNWLGVLFGFLFMVLGLIFLLLTLSMLVGGGGLHAISITRYVMQAACFAVPGVVFLIMAIRFLGQTPR